MLPTFCAFMVLSRRFALRVKRANRASCYPPTSIAGREAPYEQGNSMNTVLRIAVAASGFLALVLLLVAGPLYQLEWLGLSQAFGLMRWAFRSEERRVGKEGKGGW